MKNKKKISEYIIKTIDNSSYFVFVAAGESAVCVDVQNTEKIINSFF